MHGAHFVEHGIAERARQSGFKPYRKFALHVKRRAETFLLPERSAHSAFASSLGARPQLKKREPFFEIKRKR